MSDVAKPAPKKGKLKLILMGGIGVAALLGGGVAAGVYVSGGLHKGKQAIEEDPNRPKLVLKDGGEEDGHGMDDDRNSKGRPDPSKYKASYLEMEQSFTSNVRDSDGFIQVGLGVSTFYDEKVLDNVKNNVVPIRSAVLMTLANQDSIVVSTPEGKKALQKALTDAINDVLVRQEGFGGIDDVYFTSFIIQ